MARYERTDFFIPWPGFDLADQRAPHPAPPAIPGPSKFVATEAALRDWAPAAPTISGPASADEYLASILARGQKIQPKQLASDIPAEPPPNSIPFDETNAIATPGNTGVETLVTRFRVPFGQNGMINDLHNVFTGVGFNEGSGDLVWRIRVGAPGLVGKPVRNYSSIKWTKVFGGTGKVYGGIPVFSDQYVEYSITHAVVSAIVPAGTRIICGFKGLLWPIPRKR